VHPGCASGVGPPRALATGVLDRHVEERQEHRRHGCEGVIEVLEVRAHPVAEGCPILAVVEVEVALEQPDDRGIRGGLADCGPLRV
jgi:hypothetical protein